MSATPEILAQGAVRIRVPKVVPPYSPKGLLESRLVQFAICSRGLGIVSFILFLLLRMPFGKHISVITLMTLGHMGWKGAQDGVRGGILKVVPPLLPKGTLGELFGALWDPPQMQILVL